MISIFTPKKSERLTFVLDFCFKEKNLEYELITSAEEWNNSNSTKFTYSKEIMDCDYAVEPSGLLFEEDIDEHLKLEKEGDKLMLRGSKDPLSIIFYLLSRYEEYQPHEKDKHGRFASSQSQQTALGYLYDPVVDRIVLKLWHKLGLDYNVILGGFECVPSFDIDVAWAYKNRPFWRIAGAFSKGNFAERVGVLVGGKKDPYDTYSEIVRISTEVDRIICFSAVSDYGPLDKNIDWKNDHYRSLIRGLNSTGGMGLHPGYASFLNAIKIGEEKERMEEILGHDVKKSRFHFLRFEIPTSYQLMIEEGFTKDYSMGYADNAGFRAGTSFPFYFFDLSKNCRTTYLLFPFCYMDSALKDNLKLGMAESEELIKKLMDEVKNVGGLFMCIWHNSSITDKGEWSNWLELLNKTVQWSKE